MRIIDDKTKNLYWWNRNYFYIGTLFIIGLNFLLFFVLEKGWSYQMCDPDVSPGAQLNFINFVCSFLNCFAHSSLDHVLGNMICFLVIGTFLERKYGSLPIIGLTFFVALFASLAVSANGVDAVWGGFSIVNFAFYGWILIDFLFLFKKGKKSKANIIYGAVILALIYLFMCCKNFSTFSFVWYPDDLLCYLGHYTGFLVGMILACFVNIFRLVSVKEHKSEN